MIRLRLDEVVALAAGQLTTAPGAKEITGVTVDSRRIESGDLFVAIGRGVDHLYLFAVPYSSGLAFDDHDDVGERHVERGQWHALE